MVGDHCYWRTRRRRHYCRMERLAPRRALEHPRLFYRLHRTRSAGRPPEASGRHRGSSVGCLLAMGRPGVHGISRSCHRSQPIVDTEKTRQDAVKDIGKGCFFKHERIEGEDRQEAHRVSRHCRHRQRLGVGQRAATALAALLVVPTTGYICSTHIHPAKCHGVPNTSTRRHHPGHARDVRLPCLVKNVLLSGHMQRGHSGALRCLARNIADGIVAQKKSNCLGSNGVQPPLYQLPI